MNGQDLYERAKKIIPGGTQLLSKRPEMFLPGQWPSYYERCSGAEVWDLEGRKYVDMSISGVGACILGYADPDVDSAVMSAIKKGTMSTLNCPEEVYLAELLIEIHPWAEMARFARCGGEALSIAVRIARAATGRDRIAFCGYHGWHDWYLSANLASEGNLDGQLLPGLDPVGVPRALRETSIPFKYNDIAEFDSVIDRYGHDIAAVVMEPVRHSEPEKGFLEHIRRRTAEKNIVLVFDEVTSGWRMNPGGIHLTFGISPDMAVFAKGMSNGYPMAAIIGVRGVMEAAQKSFISSTYWTERIGPTAALAVIWKMRDGKVNERLIRIGEAVRNSWRDAALQSGLAIGVHGIPPLSTFAFDSARYGESVPVMHTLFTQEMLGRGYLASKAFYATNAHSGEQVAWYAAAVAETFRSVRAGLDGGNIEGMLRGPVAHAGFKRLA